MRVLTKLKDDFKADPILYRLYYGLMLPDIAHRNGLDATPYVKARLHEIHKKYLNYPSTAGTTQGTMSKFLFEVCALWACHGIFVRTKEDQPLDIERMAFTDIVEINGEKKMVWDIL
jgi:hypothetical protein